MIPETFTTANDAKAEIVTSIEASQVVSADKYDIDAIFDATYTFDAERQVFEQAVDADEFWVIVRQHEREAQR